MIRRPGNSSMRMDMSAQGRTCWETICLSTVIIVQLFILIIPEKTLFYYTAKNFSGMPFKSKANYYEKI